MEVILFLMLSASAFADVIPGYATENINLPHVTEPLVIQRLEGGKIHVAQVPGVLNWKVPLSAKDTGPYAAEVMCDAIQKNVMIKSPVSIPVAVNPVTTEAVAAAAGVSPDQIENPVGLYSVKFVSVSLSEGASSLKPQFSSVQGGASDISTWISSLIWWLNDNKRTPVYSINLVNSNALACDLISGNATIEYDTWIKLPQHSPATTEILSLNEISGLYNGIKNVQLPDANPQALLGLELYRSSKKIGLDEKLSNLTAQFWVNLVNGIFDGRQIRTLGANDLTNVAGSMRQVDANSNYQHVVARTQAYAQ